MASSSSPQPVTCRRHPRWCCFLSRCLRPGRRHHRPGDHRLPRCFHRAAKKPNRPHPYFPIAFRVSSGKWTPLVESENTLTAFISTSPDNFQFTHAPRRRVEELPWTKFLIEARKIDAAKPLEVDPILASVGNLADNVKLALQGVAEDISSIPDS